MPSLADNRATWNARESWQAHGDEWSGPWGSTELLWHGTLFPRLQAFLPASTVLELGPGHGRFTQYLKDLCQRLVLVDLADSCIDACRERFAGARNIEYHVNDGKSLAVVPDRAIDVVFSFDSLVHAERDVLEAYLGQLATKLTQDGVGFVHHSNIGSYRTGAAVARRIPDRLRRPLTRSRLVVDTYAWRADTTAEEVADLCARSGLSCIVQEKIPWQYGRGLSDTISLFTLPGSRWDRTPTVVENRDFMKEAARLARIGALYDPAATRSSSST